LYTARKEVPAAKNILSALKMNLHTVRKEVSVLKNISATFESTH
jgi:hypothetical protein